MISSAVAFLLAMIYLLAFAAHVRRARVTEAMIPLSLPPLLLMSFAAWVACAHNAQQPGAADVRWVLHFGGVVTLLAALLPIAQGRRLGLVSSSRPPIIVPALAWLTSFGALATAIAKPTGFAAWNLSLAGAFLSLALLPAVAISASIAKRNAVAPSQQLVPLGIMGGLGVVQGVVAWVFV